MHFPFYVVHSGKRQRPLPTPFSNAHCLRKVQRPIVGAPLLASHPTKVKFDNCR